MRQGPSVDKQRCRGGKVTVWTTHRLPLMRSSRRWAHVCGPAPTTRSDAGPALGDHGDLGQHPFPHAFSNPNPQPTEVLILFGPQANACICAPARKRVRTPDLAHDRRPDPLPPSVDHVRNSLPWRNLHRATHRTTVAELRAPSWTCATHSSNRLDREPGDSRAVNGTVGARTRCSQ